MAPRLAHKKSRKGCIRCKERKVKCSEDFPSCTACYRHGVPCEYADAPGSSTSMDKQLSQSTRSSDHGDTISRSSPGLEVPYSLNILANFNIPDSRRNAVEMYFIHRFKTSVATAFSGADNPEKRDIWVIDAVDLAFDFPYLLNAVFAITSLYIWITSTDPRNESEGKPLPESLRGVDFAQLHRMYLNLSICQQRDAMVTLTPDNADAVGLAAFLHSTMATCLLADEAETEQLLYTPPIQWMQMHASISTVYINAVPVLRPDGPMSRYSLRSNMYDYFNPATACDPQRISPFRKLLDFRDPTSSTIQDEESDPSVEDAYTKAVAYIGGMHHAAVLQIEGRHAMCIRVIAFGHTIPKTFIRLLAARRPRALAILANFMAFVRHIDYYWWFRQRADREIAGIRQILPQQWHWALSWPLAVLQDPNQILSDPRQFQEVPLP
jgi:hypothetical protein